MFRTLLISFIIGVFLFIFCSRKKVSNLLIGFSFLVLLAASIMLWYLKHDSSLGRLHIWKLSWQMLIKQSMWHGIGVAQFNVEYNHAQAAYFSELSLYTKEAMLADDGYYAFNEFMHVGIEYGWWAGVLLLFLFMWFVWQNWLVVKRKEGFSFPLVCILLLWPVAIGCWVGYPLHKTWLAIGAALLMSLLAISGLSNKWKKMAMSLVMVVSVLYSSFKGYQYWQQEQVLSNAKESWQSGEKHFAISQLQAYCANHPKAMPHHVLLAKWYWLVNEEAKAIAVLEKHHIFHCNQRIHETLGKWYAGRKQFALAEQHFLTGLFITPHKLQSRALLANLYAAWGRPNLAKKWTQEVIQYPAKFSTALAHQLKQSASMYLAGNIINTSFIFNDPICKW
jgi:hypothetical protein